MKGTSTVSLIFFFIGVLINGAFAGLRANAPDSKIRVACVGNSITYGMKLQNREKYSYPAVLQELLGDRYSVGNFGKNGATLLYKGHRPYIDQPEFQEALKFKPQILVIHLGVNDTDPRDFPDFGDEFVKDYVSLIDSFKNVNPEVRVIIANLSPLHAKHYRFKSGTRAWRDSIRNLIPEIAKTTDAELIDFSHALKDRPNFIPDGIHPDKNGAKLLAEAVCRAITGHYGGLKLPQIYGDHMVLQRYKPIKVSGKSDAGDSITVSVGKHKSTVITDNSGNWTALLPPLAEQTCLKLTVTNGKDTIIFNDIAIGEVWIASGQSNMEYQMRFTSTWQEDKENTDDSLLRLFNMKPQVYTTAQEWSEEKKSMVDNLDYFKDTYWKSSNEETAKDFSAVAWHYGKILRDSLKVPVGIISNAIGGAPAEAWIDIETLEHNIPEILVDWRTNDYLQPWVQQRIRENVGEINDSVSHRHPYEPSYLFASGIRPLASFPVAGTVWYQGESNAHNIEVHETLFESLLESWRKYWQQPEMPFIFVQLSSIDRPSWPWFRDSQRRLADRNVNVRMAVSSDLGDSLDVHPKNKRPIGERLARQALNHVYSMTQITPQGPSPKKGYQSAENEITIEFDFAEGLKTSDGNKPFIFEVAGSDGIFIEMENVEIINNRIVLKEMKVNNPQYVRYGWQPFTRANLVNGEGLPASTFKIGIESLQNSNIEDGFESGLSGSFTGVIDGDLIIAGGSNFPNNPMSPSSIKKFYQGIYKLSESEQNNWTAEKIGNLPMTVAYGSAVTLPEGILIIGGADGIKSFKETYLLSKTGNDEITFEEYPTLPGTIDNAYAAVCNGKVYIAGGNFNGIPSNRLFKLDLGNLDKGWQELEAFPGNPRVQPVMAGVRNSKGKEYLYLWGGFAGKDEDRAASLETDGLRYNIEKNKWDKLPGPKDSKGNEISLGGGAITVLADGSLVAIGGVNKDIFLAALRNQAPDYLSHNIDWYKFNPNILVFNPENEKWSISEESSYTARAGAGIVSTEDNEIIVVGGELKPRIRTTDIFKAKIN